MTAAATVLVIAPPERRPDSPHLETAADASGCTPALPQRLMQPARRCGCWRRTAVTAAGIEAAFHVAGEAGVGFELARRRNKHQRAREPEIKFGQPGSADPRPGAPAWCCRVRFPGSRADAPFFTPPRTRRYRGSSTREFFPCVLDQIERIGIDVRCSPSVRTMTSVPSAFDRDLRPRLCIAGAGLSTRLGTALRHAGEVISHARSFRKLVIVLTDGEPSDIDTDPLDLIEDASRASLGLKSRGIDGFGVVLDPGGISAAARIFGRGNTMLVHRVEDLPSRLSELYFRLARR